MDTNRKIKLGFLGGLVLLGCVALTAVLATQRLVQDAQWVAHTHQVRSTIRELDAQIREAKSNVRSFLLTGDSSYVSRYRVSVDSAGESLRLLQRLTADNAGQQARLRTLSALFDDRVVSFEQTLALGAVRTRELPSGGSASRLAILLGGGETLSARIGDVIAAFDRVEQELLVQRARAERQSEKVVRFVIVAFVLAGAGIAWLLRRSIDGDLEAQRRADQLLRESEAKFSGILSIAADAIITVDDQQRIQHFNEGAEHIFGYAASELLGRPLDVLLPAALAASHRGHIAGFARASESARRMGDRRQVLGRRKNGDEFPADASISKLATSQGMLFTVVLRDISEQKRIERHEHVLAESGRKLVGSIEYENVVRVVTNLAVPDIGDWCVLDVLESRDDKPSFRRLVSQVADSEQTAGLLILETHVLDEDSPSRVLDVMRTRRAELVTHVDDEWLDARSDPRDVDSLRSLRVRSLLIVPLQTAEHLLGAMTVAAGESRRRLDAADLALAQALADRAALAIDNALHHRDARRATAVRDEVLSVVSHDLRNPLSAVSMCARTLLDHPPADEAARQRLYRSTLDAADWMHRLMQDLLDAASIDAGRLSVEMEPQSVPHLLEAGVHALSRRAETDGVRLAIECDSRMPLVNADGSRVLQVLSNLIGNAIKYSARGSMVTLGATPGRNEVILWVRDHGSGIAPEHLPHLFDRFWHLRGASRTHGTGLGLAIAKGIVAAHGGRIWVESTEAGGSTFYFTLAYSAGAVAPAHPIPRVPEPSVGLGHRS